MLQFFNFLGKSDSENQISAINGYLNSFNAYLVVSKIHKEKYAGLFKKLGFMIGLVICIILL